MKTKVLLFGILAEEAGLSELEVDNVSSLDELKKQIIEKYPSFSGYKYRISVNHSLVDDDVRLNADDELALLPPFAGG